MNIPIDYKIGIGALVAVVLGWLLGQGTTIVRDWKTRQRIKHGLLVELEDARQELTRVIWIHARALQLSAHDGLEWSYNAIPVNAFFFRNSYKDVFVRLNHAQRLSYQETHAAIDQVNKDSERLEQLLRTLDEKFRTKGLAPGDFEAWNTHVKMAFRSAKTALWHVNHHLANPDNPSLDFLGAVHEGYLKYLDTVDAEIEKIIREAKALNPLDFVKTYDPRSFPKGRPTK